MQQVRFLTIKENQIKIKIKIKRIQKKIVQIKEQIVIMNLTIKFIKIIMFNKMIKYRDIEVILKMSIKNQKNQ